MFTIALTLLLDIKEAGSHSNWQFGLSLYHVLKIKAIGLTFHNLQSESLINKNITMKNLHLC